METLAERIETSRQTLREQLASFADRTREAGRAFVFETKEASLDLAQSVRGEAKAWAELVTSRTGKLLEAGSLPETPTLPPADVDALERRLLVGLRDILSRVDVQLQSRLEKEAAKGSEPVAGYDDLSAKEVVSLIAELEPSAVEAIASYEAAHKGRKTILRATERKAA